MDCFHCNLLRRTGGRTGGPICEQLVFVAESDEGEAAIASLDITDSEKQYLCGREENPSWDEIPLHQATGFLHSFLESRGYHQPSVEPSGGVLRVKLGPRSFFQTIQVTGAPKEFDASRARGFPGRVLTPGLLDEMESWAMHRLRQAGYPCATIDSRADPRTGHIDVTINAGSKQVLGAVSRNDLGEELATEAAGRYQAFDPGDRYDGQKIELSERRPRQNGLLLNTFYLFDCDDSAEVLDLRQQSALGTPRLITFGVGINTEGLLVTKAVFHHRRLDRMGSSFRTSVQASRPVQELETTYQWYLSPATRWHLQPRLVLRHADERHYQTASLKLSVGPAVSFDIDNVRVHLELGPAWEMTRTYRGQGQAETRSLLSEGGVTLQSHDHEYFQTTPRSGFTSSLRAVSAEKKLQATYTASKITWTGQWLWNIARFDPPLAVLGLRWRFAQTAADDQTLRGLPSSVLHYLGGSKDIRGFDRQELPLEGAPQRQLGYLGLELRHAFAHHPQWQPFAFLDAGKLGQERGEFAPPIYWSPGLGGRWESLFGVFRTTLAKGFIANAEEFSSKQVERHTHWQFYFSFGEEF